MRKLLFTSFTMASFSGITEVTWGNPPDDAWCSPNKGNYEKVKQEETKKGKRKAEKNQDVQKDCVASCSSSFIKVKSAPEQISISPELVEKMISMLQETPTCCSPKHSPDDLESRIKIEMLKDRFPDDYQVAPKPVVPKRILPPPLWYRFNIEQVTNPQISRIALQERLIALNQLDPNKANEKFGEINIKWLTNYKKWEVKRTKSSISNIQGHCYYSYLAEFRQDLSEIEKLIDQTRRDLGMNN